MRARSTVKRLRGGQGRGAAAPETADAIVNAQRTILAAVIAQQLVDTESGIPLLARVALDRICKAERAQLKAALETVDEAVGLVAEGRI